MTGQLADPLDDVVGRQEPVAPGSRTVPARRDRVGLPGRQLLEVVGSSRRIDGGDHRGQGAEHPARVAHDRHLDRDVLADLGRVDVDVDDPGVGGIRADVAGHPVVEAHPDGDEQVRALDRPVDVLPAVHAHVAVGERVRLVDDADPEQRPGHGDLGLLGERQQVVPGLRVEHPVAGEDDRPLGRGDLAGRGLELLGVAVEIGAEAGQAGDDLLVGRVLRPRLLLERVLGDVHVDRAGPTGPGDVEGLGDDAREVVGIAHEVVVLGHRQGDAVDVDLLERVLAEEGGRHVPGDGDHRDGIQQGGPDAGDQVGRAGTGRAHAHADPAGDAGVAVGGMRPALLVADEHVAQFRVVAQHVIQREDHAARVAEEDVDTLAQERLAQDVRPDARPLQVTRLVEHPLPGPFDGGRAGRPVVRHVAATDRSCRSSRPARARRCRRFAFRECHRLVEPPRSGPASRPGMQKTLASRRGSLRSSVVRVPSARSSAFLRSPAGSR